MHEKDVRNATERYDNPTFKGMRILEALAASGLRSMRYANEVTQGVGIEEIVMNDLESSAVENMRRNLSFNGLDCPESKLRISHSDAIDLMHKYRVDSADSMALPDKTRVTSFLKQSDGSVHKQSSFDIIDLDPYGSPTIFADSALQAVRDGGLLCVTATDLSTLVGNCPDNCYAKYRSMPLKLAPYGHEMAIRILLSYLDSVASKYGRYIVPLMSVHMDFYIRVFIRVYSSKREVKLAATRSSMVYHSKCGGSFWLQPLCTQKTGIINKAEHSDNPNSLDHGIRPAVSNVPAVCTESGAALAIGGPIWNGPIHNQAFVKSLLNKFSKKGGSGFKAQDLGSADIIHGVIDAVAAEIATPFYYDLPGMSKLIHTCTPCVLKFQSALVNSGYKVSQAHSNPQGMKTDAPPSVIWDIMRTWYKQNPGKQRIYGKYVQALLDKEITTEVDFTVSSAVRRKRNYLIRRYKPNPQKNWGPKPAAQGSHSRQTHRRNKKRQTDSVVTPIDGKRSKQSNTGKMHLFDL